MKKFEDILNVQVHHEIVINICSTENYRIASTFIILRDTKHPWVVSEPPK